MLPVFMTVFVLSNCIGLSLIKPVLADGALKTGNVDLPFEASYFAWQCLAHWCFMLMGYVILRVFYDPDERDSGVAGNFLGRRFFGFGMAALAGGIVLYVPYMFMGPGMELLHGTRLFHFDFDEASDYRREMMNNLQAGQGYFRAQAAANSLFPLAAFFINFSLAARWVRMGITGVCFMLTLGFALCLRQKAPLVVCTLCYGALLMLSGAQAQFLESKLPQASRKHWVLLALGVSLISGGLYWAMEGGDLLDAAEKVLLRNFVAPAATSHLWFYVFPERFEFRGFFESLYVVPASVSRDTITIEDVASRATGFEFVANASLVAIGWSGAGMPGVLFASVSFFAIVMLVDRVIRGMPLNIQLGVMALSAASVVQLTSCSLGDFVLGGSMMAVMLVCLGYKMAESREDYHASRNRFAFHTTR